MKDYHDLILLIRSKELNSEKLTSAIAETFKTRETPLVNEIKFSSSELRSLQQLWGSHLRNLDEVANTLDLPKNIEEVIKEINVGMKALS